MRNIIATLIGMCILSSERSIAVKNDLCSVYCRLRADVSERGLDRIVGHYFSSPKLSLNHNGLMCCGSDPLYWVNIIIKTETYRQAAFTKTGLLVGWFWLLRWAPWKTGGAMANKSTRSSSMLGALGMQAASKYVNVVVQLVITMVLARLLTPDEFGTVAVVTVFLAFFNILADFGISTAIVQYRDLTDEDYDGLFFFSLLMGFALAAAFCLLGLPVASLYGDEELVSLCCASAPAVLFATLNMVPNGLLLQRKHFRSISVRLVVASLGSGALAVALALGSAGCYALVAQSVFNAGIVFVWNWASTQPKLSNPHFMPPLRRIFRFSAYQGGFSVINYLARNLDNMLVGATMGSAALGYYDKAYKLMQYPINYLPGVFSSVLQPYLSDYRNDHCRIYECWLEICRLLAVVGFAVAAVFVSFASEVVWVMYGDQWVAAAPALTTLVLSLGPQMVNSTSGAVFQSVGRTDLLFRSGLVCTAISLVAILVGVASGRLAALGLFVSFAYYAHLGVTAWLLVRGVFGVRPTAFLRSFLWPATGFVAACVAQLEVGRLLATAPTAAVLVARAAACCGAYLLVMAATGRACDFKVFSEMKSMGVK